MPNCDIGYDCLHCTHPDCIDNTKNLPPDPFNRRALAEFAKVASKESAEASERRKARYKAKLAAEGKEFVGSGNWRKRKTG